MSRLLKMLFAVIALALGVALCLLFTGPRMRDQINIRTYQAQAPATPEGSAPVEAPPGAPMDEELAGLTNPLAATADNVERGRTYYQYYCVFCHGGTGAGDGEAGRSFFPSPPSLHSARVQSASDGSLFRTMLTGVGHEPVLAYTVLPEHRWYLVLYLRSLSEP